MSESTTPPPRRSALANVWHPGDHGRIGFTGPQVTLRERRDITAIQLDAQRGTTDGVGKAVAAAFGLGLPGPGRATTTGDVRALWLGPDRWLLQTATPADLEPRLRSLTEGVGGVVVDQSHGRTILRIEGAKARDTLAKSTGIDLHPRAFAENAVAQTSLFQLAVTIDRRRGTSIFDVHAMRGFAVHLYEALLDAGGEYGVRLV
ncbi:MAG: hypothetical protein HQ481_11915 [Alphaproteobacteria bacterium]|nr:hypothetical protein [Alphaproteobacteria bacterium]